MKDSSLLHHNINFNGNNSLNLLGRASNFVSAKVRNCEKALESDKLVQKEAKQRFDNQKTVMQDFSALKL